MLFVEVQKHYSRWSYLNTLSNWLWESTIFNKTT